MKPIKRTKYNNDKANSDEKIEARERKFIHYKESEVEKDVILSFPQKEFYFEQMINNKISKKFRYCLVECDDKVYKKIDAKAQKLNLHIHSTHNYFLNEIVLRSLPNDYSHMDLDYCGQFNNRVEEIANVIKKNLVKVNGIISITLANRVSGDQTFTKKFEKLYGGKIIEGQRTMVALKNLVKFFGGKRYVIKDEFTYKGSANMIQMVIKRIK